MLNKQQATPLIIFIIIFLVYSLYFIQTIQNPERSKGSALLKSLQQLDSPDSVSLSDIPAKNILNKASEVLEVINQPLVPQKRYTYVNFDFLNLREQPGTQSTITEKLKRNDKLEVLVYTNDLWAEVKSPSGNRGYVARSYLSDTESVVPYSQTIRVPVLLYHHVTDQPVSEAPVLVLATKNFQVQLAYLAANNWNTIGFKDLAKLKEEKRAPSEKSIILAFDDAYSNHYTAAQKLKEKGLKGVFFIPTDLVGTEGYLTWHQIREMVEWGMELGSQGKSHNYLGGSAASMVISEISGSKEIIEKESGTKVYAFAYPSGSYTNTTIAAVEAAGYSFARTKASGDRYNLNSPFNIPVLRIFPTAAERQLKAWLE
jgi:peptidoglycan/xylan/chitin deacetylase (PgdA/CDA1 family)